MSIGSRVGNPRDDRAAMRALYLNILVSTVGLAAYDPADDANLDKIDDIVESIYSRIAKKGSGERIEQPAETRLPPASTLPGREPAVEADEDEAPQVAHVSDPEPA